MHHKSSYISTAEKTVIHKEWLRIQDEYAKKTEHAHGELSKWKAFEETYDALSEYLSSKTSVFLDMNSDTVLEEVGSDETEWFSKWKAYYSCFEEYRAQVRLEYYN